MDTIKNYQPEPIPARRTVDSTCTQITEPAKKIENQSCSEVRFAEVTLESGNPGSGTALPSPQSIRPAPDEKRALFYEMRKIAHRDTSFIGNPSKVFYCQAQMMEDFSDNFASQIPFSFYYPYYQLMGYGQLRTYFTWRTKVRAGEIKRTSLSYAFLYIYELLSCIGEHDPSVSLQKLKHFWKTYREFDRVIDEYMIRWIRDYYIYYPLEQSFLDFVIEQNMKMCYPQVFIYSSDRENSFEMYSDLSSYDIRKSIFYTEETWELIRDCFYFLLCRMRKLCKAANKVFEDFVLYSAKSETEWKPFSGALFYPYLKQPDRTVVLSDREVYTCRKNRWTYHTGIPLDGGRDLIGYIMKEMESVLREKLHFRYKLHASTDKCEPNVLEKLKDVGISFPQIISIGVMDFLTLRGRKPVRVDKEAISRIRTESLETQGKLIVPEDEAADTLVNSPRETTAPVLTMNNLENVWAAFVSVLSDTEKAALREILLEEDVKAFADANGIMIEVLLDSINEKAMDTVGDTLVEIDETVIVYEEYKDKLMELTALIHP